MKNLYDVVSYKSSKLITRHYSTSFSLGIRLLKKEFHNPIYAIYGFVRIADEIVDTFHDYDKTLLLAELKRDVFLSIERKISVNPVLNSFQEVVNKYNIESGLINLFLKSMEIDLENKDHTPESYNEYILGSAEVVGLMCLKVFTENDDALYLKLKPYAMALGSAFQKINFLRDLNADFIGMGRTYFPNIDVNQLNDSNKIDIENDIELDFIKGYEGIKLLPKNARFGVYMAYIYYLSLFKKIKNVNASRILEERIRIPNSKKVILIAESYLRNTLNLL